MSPVCGCHCILHVRSGGGCNYTRQISGESAHGVWEPLLLKTDPPPLTWRIALTTVYALTCYTVITVEFQEEIVASGVGTGGSGGSMNWGPRAPGARVVGPHIFLGKTLRKIIKIVATR